MGIGSFFEYPKPERVTFEDSIFNYLVNKNQSNFFFRDGRQAIKAVLLNNSDHQNDELKYFLPKYLCSSILQPFKELNLPITFYGHNHPLKPRIDKNLENSLVFIIDYFGVESISNDDVLTLLENHNTIIMDITHSILSKTRFRIQHEDYYIISSLRKIFPIPDGGILYHNNPKFIIEKTFPTGHTKMLEAMKLKSLKKEKGCYLEKYRNYEKEKDCNKIILQEIPDCSIQILKKINMSNILIKRTENINFLYNNLKGNYFLFKKEEIKSPFFMPLLFHDEKQRNNIKTHLINNEIYPPFHWELPLGITDDYEISISNRILSLPIDQRYCQQDMQKIVTILNELFEQNSNMNNHTFEES